MRLCSVEGCGRKHRCKGLCGPHYAAHFRPLRPVHPELTQDRLKALLRYEPNEGMFYRLAGLRTDLIGPAKIKASPNKDGYPRLEVDGRRYYCHRLAWFYVHGEWVDEIDHRDGDHGNYRIDNLRPATSRVNRQNRRGPGKGNTSGYLGVSMDRARGLWVARIKLPTGKYKHLGRYSTKEEAYAVYLEAKRRYHEGCTI